MTQTNSHNSKISDIRSFPGKNTAALKKANLKTLIICPIGLGNFIMATPGLALLSNVIGKKNLHLLALKPGIRQMGEESGWFGRVHYWNPDGESIFRGMALLGRLRKHQFDLSFSLFPTSHWKFCLFSRIIAAKQRIGFQYAYTSLPAFTQTYSLLSRDNLHDAEQNLLLIQTYLQLPKTPPSAFQFTIPLQSLPQTIAHVLQKPFFVCHPGSSLQRGMEEKRLPVDKFCFFIEHIHRQFNLKCVLLGGPEEADLRHLIMKKSGSCILKVDTANLGEVGTCIKKSCFFIGNDSGLMHMAVALEKKCIAFFGPSDESRTGPYYLANEPRDNTDDVSRGHLILRQDKVFMDTSKKSINPRLRNVGNPGLKQLDVEKSWEKIRIFISEILKN